MVVRGWFLPVSPQGFLSPGDPCPDTAPQAAPSPTLSGQGRHPLIEGILPTSQIWLRAGRVCPRLTQQVRGQPDPGLLSVRSESSAEQPRTEQDPQLR